MGSRLIVNGSKANGCKATAILFYSSDSKMNIIIMMEMMDILLKIVNDNISDKNTDLIITDDNRNCDNDKMMMMIIIMTIIIVAEAAVVMVVSRGSSSCSNDN